MKVDILEVRHKRKVNPGGYCRGEGGLGGLGDVVVNKKEPSSPSVSNQMVRAPDSRSYIKFCLWIGKRGRQKVKLT